MPSLCDSIVWFCTQGIACVGKLAASGEANALEMKIALDDGKEEKVFLLAVFVTVVIAGTDWIRRCTLLGRLLDLRSHWSVRSSSKMPIGFLKRVPSCSELSWVGMASSKLLQAD